MINSVSNHLFYLYFSQVMSSYDSDYEFDEKVYVKKAYNKMKAKISPKKIAYSNQKEAAKKVMTEFDKGKISVVLVAQPGAGKTGTFGYIAYKMVMKGKFSYNDIYFISGMSDLDWKETIKSGILSPFRKNIYHRNNFDDLKKKWLEKKPKNILIIQDECHIAAGKDQQLSLMLKECGLLDINYIKDNNIKFLAVSATPGRVKKDLQKWGKEYTGAVLLKNADSYRGFQFLKDNDLLRPPLFLSKKEDCKDISKTIKERWNKPLYHIIRSGTKVYDIVLQNITSMCKKEGWVVREHNAKNRIEDIDEVMSSRPSVHTFILVKGFWRAGKRLVRKYVGVVSETSQKHRNSDVTAQGLVGRFCDNDSSTFNPLKSTLFFCDVEAINQYIDLVEHKFNYDDIVYERNWKRSFADKQNVEGLEEDEEEEDVELSEDSEDSQYEYHNEEEVESDIRRFRTFRL